MSAARTVAGVGGAPRACWVRLRFRPVGLSWRLRVVGAPFMTPAAARRRQDVGRTDSRGCWAGRREVLGSPVVSPCRATGVINGAPTFGVVAMRWLAAGGGCYGAAAGVLGSPAVSPCRVILVSMCRRGAIYDARCRPQAARCRPHGPPRMLGGPPRVLGGPSRMLGVSPRACGHPPVVSPCRATGVINGAPTFGVVVTDGWPQVVDVGWAAASVLGSPVVSPCRVILAFACRRGAIYDARCRPWAARCRPHGQSRVLGGPPRMLGVSSRACGHPPVVSPCRATGVINGAPTFGVVATGWLAAGGGCWVSRRGRVLLACLSFLPRRPFLLPRRPSDRVLRRYGQVDCRRRGGWRGMDRAVRYTFYYI